MNVAFAAPWSLLGLGLLALPVIAHLTGYREVRTVDFPTLRFLRASQVKVRKRTRFEALLLLLLRLLAVAAVVLLFARPSLTWTAPAPAGFDPDTTTLILLDRSASMQLKGADGVVFDRAKAAAEELLDGLSEGTAAGLLLFDARAEAAGGGLTDDLRAVRELLDEAEAGAGGTDLDRALRRARELLRDSSVERANLFVLSDGTAGTVPAGLDADWSEGWRVHYHDLLQRTPSNRFPVRATVRSGARRGEGLRVAGELRAVGPESRGAAPVTLAVPPDLEVVRDAEFGEDGVAKADFSLPLPPEGRVRAELRLPEDELAVDDRLAMLLQGDAELEVLLVSGDGGLQPRDDEAYYLDKALQPGPGSLSRVRPRVLKAEELRRIDGGRGDVVFLANVADPEPLREELTAFVRRGGGLFVSVGARVDGDRYDETLGDLLPARLTDVKTRWEGTFEASPLGLGLPPLERDEFRVFRTGGASVFGRVRFGKVFGTEPALNPDSEVLLRYSDALPALLERRVGEGRVVLFTSTLDDDWTDLPLRSIFVPLVHQFARSLSGTLLLDGVSGVDVGGTIALPVPPDRDERVWVVRPDGRELPLDAGAADRDGRVSFAGTELPGHYELHWGLGDGGVLRMLFTVRVPEEESLLRRVDREELLRSVPGLVFHDAGGVVSEGDRGEVIRTSSLGPAVIALMLLALLGEGLLSGRRA